MLTPQEIIDAAEERLEDEKLSPLDVDKLITAFRLVIGALETVYSYKFEDKLTALTDANNDFQRCAQLAACLTRMEELGFPVGELTGSSFGIKASEHTEFRGYVLYAFSKVYPIPAELSGNILLVRNRVRSSRAYIDRKFV